MPTIQFPRRLRPYIDHHESLTLHGDTLLAVIKQLTEKYPAVTPYLIDQNDRICSFICIYVNGKDIRWLKNESTPLHEDDIITIIPAIAGG